MIFASIAFLISLVFVTEPSIARSLDPRDCPSDRRRVEFRDLIFCWPTDQTAPRFGFINQDKLLGRQDWIGKRPARSGRAYDEVGDRVGAYFTIVPFDAALLRSERLLLEAAEIRAVLEKAAGNPEPVVELFMGRFGMRELRFRELEPNLFAAVLAIEDDDWGSLTIEYWTSLNRYGALDYIFSCNDVAQVRMCSGHFPLASSIATVTVDYAENSDQSHYIFEAMRAQIRSYVLYPNLNDDL